jgi:predicted aminopeptidase
MHRFKKWRYLILLIILIVSAFYYESISYGISQAYGQLKIVAQAKPLEDVLQDPAFPDSLKAKLRLIQEIRKFAFDSIGLNQSDNYTTVYDQGGKPILWVVTACEPFQLKAKEWKFPFLGSFSYKGFFKYEWAVKEEAALKEEDYDTSIDEVSGWSTLGWFKDPVLTNMLKRSPGSLANLIIHELTHGTLYVKNSVEFNENLANFVGDKGALKFLEYKYGKKSTEYKDYTENRQLTKGYVNLVLKHGDRLDSLYNGFLPSMSREEKKREKEDLFKKVKSDLSSYLLNFKSSGSKYNRDIMEINNTYFMDFKRYNQDLDFFEEEFAKKFDSDFKLYFKYLKNKYPSL